MPNRRPPEYTSGGHSDQKNEKRNIPSSCFRVAFYLSRQPITLFQKSQSRKTENERIDLKTGYLCGISYISILRKIIRKQTKADSLPRKKWHEAPLSPDCKRAIPEHDSKRLILKRAIQRENDLIFIQKRRFIRVETIVPTKKINENLRDSFLQRSIAYRIT